MTKSEKKEVKRFNIITEQFCSKLGDNAIIVVTRTENGEEKRCLSAEKCKAECEHKAVRQE